MPVFAISTLRSDRNKSVNWPRPVATKSRPEFSFQPEKALFIGRYAATVTAGPHADTENGQNY